MEKIKCPDCGEELDEVTVERFQTKTFRIDYEKKTLTPVYPDQDWEDDDHACHCPHCDSLNVDESLSKYVLKECQSETIATETSPQAPA